MAQPQEPVKDQPRIDPRANKAMLAAMRATRTVREALQETNGELSKVALANLSLHH